MRLKPGGDPPAGPTDLMGALMETKSGRGGAKERNPQVARMVVAAVIVILVVWFAVANSQRVEVDYLLFSRDSRLVYVIIGAALLGAIADRLVIHRRRRDR